jgi:hypothetical protein
MSDGIECAVLFGDPAKVGEAYVIREKFPFCPAARTSIVRKHRVDHSAFRSRALGPPSFASSR